LPGSTGMNQGPPGKSAADILADDLCRLPIIAASKKLEFEFRV
jgi:hypothetical protein